MQPLLSLSFCQKRGMLSPTGWGWWGPKRQDLAGSVHGGEELSVGGTATQPVGCKVPFQGPRPGVQPQPPQCPQCHAGMEWQGGKMPDPARAVR